jgi:Fe-S cluster assembly ATPase SufC
MGELQIKNLHVSAGDKQILKGVDLHVRETAVQLVIETRGPAHAATVQQAIAGAGYAARVVR